MRIRRGARERLGQHQPWPLRLGLEPPDRRLCVGGARVGWVRVRGRGSGFGAGAVAQADESSNRAASRAGVMAPIF